MQVSPQAQANTFLRSINRTACLPNERTNDARWGEGGEEEPGIEAGIGAMSMRAPPRTRGATPTAAGEPKPDLHSLSHRRERGETDWLVPPRLWTALSWMEQAPNLSSPYM